MTATDPASQAASSDFQIELLALARVSTSGLESRATAMEQHLAMPKGSLMAAVESNRSNEKRGRKAKG